MTDQYILYDMRGGGWFSRTASLTSDWKGAKPFSADEAMAVARLRLDHNGAATCFAVALRDMETVQELIDRAEEAESREGKARQAVHRLAAINRAKVERMSIPELKQGAEETAKVWPTSPASTRSSGGGGGDDA